MDLRSGLDVGKREESFAYSEIRTARLSTRSVISTPTALHSTLILTYGCQFITFEDASFVINQSTFIKLRLL